MEAGDSLSVIDRSHKGAISDVDVERFCGTGPTEKKWEMVDGYLGGGLVHALRTALVSAGQIKGSA